MISWSRPNSLILLSILAFSSTNSEVYLGSSDDLYLYESGVNTAKDSKQLSKCSQLKGKLYGMSICMFNISTVAERKRLMSVSQHPESLFSSRDQDSLWSIITQYNFAEKLGRQTTTIRTTEDTQDDYLYDYSEEDDDEPVDQVNMEDLLNQVRVMNKALNSKIDKTNQTVRQFQDEVRKLLGKEIDQSEAIGKVYEIKNEKEESKRTISPVGRESINFFSQLDIWTVGSLAVNIILITVLIMLVIDWKRSQKRREKCSCVYRHCNHSPFVPNHVVHSDLQDRHANRAIARSGSYGLRVPSMLHNLRTASNFSPNV
jgi:hypothetical protein